MDFEDMQQFDEVVTTGDAYENDWLEVKFQQKQEEAPKQKPFSKLKAKFKKEKMQEAEQIAKEYAHVEERKQSGNVFFRVVKKAYKPVLAVGAVALLLVGMRFVDSGFVGDVFGYAKDTFTSNVANTNGKTNLTIPSNADVSVSNGDVTLTGGSIALNFLAGTVTDVTDTSVTVLAKDGLQMVYSNLKEVLVAKDQTLSQYDVVGKYQDSATVNIMQNGEKITNVTSQGYVLSW